MAQRLRILHVEDDRRDRELVAVTLADAGLACDIVAVESRDDFAAALASGGFDAILADDRLASFDGETALAMALAAAPHVPFIIVSGTVGEEAAIDRLKAGATDYVLKHRLSRLPAALGRALSEARTRAEHARAEAEIHRLNRDLERRVIERTAQLSNANAALSARETELRDAKTLLEDLLAASPALVFRIDPHTFTISYASPNVGWLLGYHPSEIVGVRGCWRTLFHEDDLDAASTHLREALEACAVQVGKEYRLRAKDGRYRWFFSQMRIEYDERNRPIAIFWYCGDITDRRAAEQALLDSEERTREILRTANDAFVGMDAAGRIANWNEQAETMFGWRREEVMGRLVAETIVPERFRDAHSRGLAHYLATGASRVLNQRLEQTAIRRDGSEFPVELTIWCTGAATERAFNAFIRDMTERHRADAAIRRAKDEAERANHAKSQFLSRMSHDLRTPLNSILGFAQLLAADGLPADRLEYVQQILNGGRHLLDLINEVLDIARIEAGQLSLSPEPVDAHEIVSHAIELVTPLAAARDITLAIAPCAGCAVVADRQRLNQIVLNLLSNAIKYNRPGGTVTVRFEVQPTGRLRIAVTDTGAGIPPEKLKLLFRAFERLGAEATPVEGTGLGLAVSRGLAEAMGGSLGVASEVDRGSTFWIDLARSDRSAEPVGSAEMPDHEVVGDGGAGTLLYVEDNLANVRLMERILDRRPQVRLLHAGTGESGLALARTHRPDAIFLDLHLPDMHGEEVLRRLWAEPHLRSIPVAVLTADATPGQTERLHASGARAHLTKPLEIGKVLTLVDRLLRNPDRSNTATDHE